MDRCSNAGMGKIPVCTFAKPPMPGRVKTRLAARIGYEAAASLASAMFCDVWSTAEQTPGVTPILAAAAEGAFPVDISPERFWLQGEGELGVRIETILRKGLREATAAIALGADSPLITTAHLTAALRELESHDAVIGPSHDGGFYLLGLRSCPPGLLDDLPWSTMKTAEKTSERLRSRGMSVSRIALLEDVDTPDDLELLRERLKTTAPEIAPATRRCLLEWLAS